MNGVKVLVKPDSSDQFLEDISDHEGATFFSFKVNIFAELRGFQFFNFFLNVGDFWWPFLFSHAYFLRGHIAPAELCPALQHTVNNYFKMSQSGIRSIGSIYWLRKDDTLTTTAGWLTKSVCMFGNQQRGAHIRPWKVAIKKFHRWDHIKDISGLGYFDETFFRISLTKCFNPTIPIHQIFIFCKILFFPLLG